MSDFQATVKWSRDGQDFLANKYSRAHSWHFDGGTVIDASASPDIVPLPWSAAENVDPEEAFVASLSSCHMLFFLAIAAGKNLQLESYVDNATGSMATNSENKMAITEVILRPVTEFSGSVLPTEEEIAKLHHLAHEQCFIANSVKTHVKIELDAVPAV